MSAQGVQFATDILKNRYGLDVEKLSLEQIWDILNLLTFFVSNRFNFKSGN